MTERKNNILLVYPSNKILKKKDNLNTYESLTPHLGLGYLAATLKKFGIGCGIIDLRLAHRDAEDITEYIKNFNPGLVAVTAFTNEVIAAGRIAELIKIRFPNLPVLLGGPHASSMPLETLKEFPSLDIACIGEGEKTIIELANNRQLREIKGIAFKKNGKLILNPPRQEIDELNELAFPAWELFEIKHYSKIFMISASRGCPYQCYFCNPAYLGKKIRIRGAKEIVDELERDIRDFDVNHFQFADASLSLLKEGIFNLCDEIISRGLHQKILWDCETRADSVTPQLLKKMKAAGCRWIAYGVETGNEEILRNIVKKGETKKEIEEAVRLTRKSGIKARCFFILGHSTETPKTIRQTVNFAINLKPDAVSFGLVVPNPGSELRKLAEKGDSDMRILHNRWEEYNQFQYSCYELRNIPLEELKKWQAKAYMLFYLHNPLKALEMIFARSGYNYKLTSILKIFTKLFSRLLEKKKENLC